MTSADNTILELNNPASDWDETFLLGNGKIGCAVYGTLKCERIDISHLAFYSGAGGNYDNQEEAHESFSEMRKLVSEGKYDLAEKASSQFIGRKNNYGTNLPVGRILIDLSDDIARGELSGYKRTLDLMNAVADVKYDYNGMRTEREYFTSFSNDCLIGKIASKGKKTDYKISFEGNGEYCRAFEKNGKYFFSAKAREKVHSDGASGTDLIGIIQILGTDGEAIIEESYISIKNAEEFVFAVKIDTNYKKELSFGNLNLSNTQMTYDALKSNHTGIASKYMGRMDISLGTGEIKTEQLFQYGRYLLMCSAIQGSPAPAHLQGIWNDNVACQIGWTCDLHLDINTQMNYWLALEGNLLECNEALFDWIEETLIPSGRMTACKNYGLKGWVAELVSNIWGYAAPYWSCDLSPCPASGIWLIAQYWEYYLHTEDESFLTERAFPVILESVEFFTAYVFKEGMYFTSGPSVSPENHFIIDNEKYAISNGPTFEITLIRELFGWYLKACEIMDLKSELRIKVEEIIDKLEPYRILKDNTLAEWNLDLEEFDPQHRHTSHLLGLFPFAQITPEKTPGLAKAAAGSIKKKMTPYSNWEDTGWARAMLLLYSTRLKDAEAAYFHLCSMRDKLTSPAMLVMHPPTRGAASFKRVYELDGNTGFSMGVIEMAVQSHDGVIRLLPALPDQWSTGYLKGVIVRGGICMDIFWENGEPAEVKLVSPKSKTVGIVYNGLSFEVALKSNIPSIIREFKKS